MGMRTPIWGQGTTTGISFDWIEIIFLIHTTIYMYNRIQPCASGRPGSYHKYTKIRDQDESVYFYIQTHSNESIELPGIQKKSSKVTISRPTQVIHCCQSLSNVHHSLLVIHGISCIFIFISITIGPICTKFLVCHVYSSSSQVLWGQSRLNFV